MSEPAPSDPKNTQSASDATQRFAAGEPPSPFSTQRLVLPKFMAEGTLKMPLPELSAPVEQTQQPTIPEPQVNSTLNMPLPHVSVPAEQTRQLNVPQILAETTLKMPLPELSVPVEQTQQLNVSQILAGSTLEMPLPKLGVHVEPTQQPSVPQIQAESTLKMPLPDLKVPAEQTQRIERPVLGEPSLPLPVWVEPDATVSQAAGFPWKLPVALLLLALAGGVAAAYLYLNRSPTRQTPPVRALAPEVVPEVVPEGARAYLDQAKAGDANAMRMLGVMYYNGLNVPQDRAKGLYWYRQAAETGSETAKAELAQLEAAGT